MPDQGIQRILRHANVKTAADDVRTAKIKLENHIAEPSPVESDTIWTPNRKLGPGSLKEGDGEMFQ